MSPVIFGGITSLYLIKGSIFLQCVEKQSYYISRSIYLTKILNRSASGDTYGGDTNFATRPNCFPFNLFHERANVGISAL